jgi:hypothetical protein
METFKGGKGGSGLFRNSGLLFGTGVVSTCPATDQSFFCKFSRVFNLIMMVFTLMFLVVMIYIIFTGKSGLFGGAVKSAMRMGK